MQPETHHAHPEDASPLPTPTSPTISAFHRPQPTPTVEAPEPISHLRRRFTNSAGPSSAGDVNESIRISIQTPFGDTAEGSSRRKEGWDVSRAKTVEQFKDELAVGEYGMGGWNREGMRLVYQGRIVRDQENLGDVVGKTINPAHTYAFHLVARRGPPTPLPRFDQFTHFSRQPSRLATPAPRPQPPTQTSRAAVLAFASHVTTSVNTLALSDTVHYLLFTARYHLFSLLGRTPLEWSQVVPPPTVGMGRAREAVMSVVKAFAAERGNREEGWENWERAFEGDSRDELKTIWEKMNGREGIERAVRDLWATNTGRIWDEQAQIEKVDVEVDGRNYSIHLPQLKDMTPAQITHFHVYLRIVSLLPLLNNVLEQSLAPPAQAAITTFIPTPTRAQPGRVIYRRQFRLVIPTIPLQVLQHVFFSALKVTAMIWMLTRGLSWSDGSFWIIAGAAGGWWLADGAARLAQHRRETRPAADQPLPRDEAQEGGEAGVAHANDGAQAEILRAQAEVQAEGDRHRRRALRSGPLIPSFIPLFHLDVDAGQLRLPPPSQTSSIAPNTLREPARNRTPRWQTKLVLPILLWFLTLIPEWESTRARAIRHRERAMRVIVGEQQQVNTDESGGAEGQEQEVVLPEGLSVHAIKYYRRVMQRGEGIDWEEEREAQRAMGVGEEDEPEGEGMRLRML